MDNRELLCYMNRTIPKHTATGFRAMVNFAGGRRIGKIVKFNYHTMWVRIMIGARTNVVVKRHVSKHNIRHIIVGGSDEDVHTSTGYETQTA